MKNLKNIYFVQANDVYGTEIKNVYIPYASGCIQAYCQKNNLISSTYKFGKFIYTKELIKDVIAKLEDPFMVLFSCSVWNMEYNKALACEIKKAYPDCFITFGGHNVSADGKEIAEFDFVDFLIHRFGEEPTEELLVNLALNKPLENICNISFKDRDGNIITTNYKMQTGTNYPSPYLEGVFDEILKDDIKFSALFESNRGCPNSCSFCDWSSLKCKVRLFPMKRVKAEIDWFAKNKIEYIYCVDANFCLFNRDSEIADYIVECKKNYGYPQIFKAFFTKNKFDFVFDVSTLFFKSGLDKAKTISFQSMNDNVLKNVGRKNISVNFFRELMKRYNEINIPTFSELILGLPGETYDSFCKGVSTLIENGQHYAINIYPCELLPNSEMGQEEYKEKFSIKSTRVPFRLIHSNNGQEKGNITEYSEYVTSTYSMNEEEWAKALTFANYIQGLHNLGLVRAIAIYCCNEYRLSYADFYNLLLEYSCNNTSKLLNDVYLKIEKLCKGIISGENELVSTCEETGNVLWGFDELIFLEFFKHFDKFYEEMMEFIISSFGGNDIIFALFEYQKNIIKKIGKKDIVIKSEYDFYNYFKKIFSNDYSSLKKKNITLTISDKAVVNSLSDYAREVVWYGRNRRATDYTSNNYQVNYSSL